MGGHGAHAIPNERNIQETDEEILTKIQLIETIKHNPNHFHLEALDVNNIYTILGGAPSAFFGVFGAFASYSYYAA